MILRRAIQKKEAKKHNSYLAGANFILYGSKSKSSIVASLTEHGDPGYVIELTPAGASSHLEQEYENFISYPIQSLKELENIVDSIHSDLTLIKRLSVIIDRLEANKNDSAAKKEMESAKKAVESRGDSWQEVYDMAKSGKLPFKAVVLAECSVVSNWISERVEELMKIDAVGADKKNMGFDWSLLKSEQRKLYMKILGIPCSTILATSEIMPSEKQNVSAILPNISVGSFGRELIDMVGNVFYSTYEDGKYVCYVNADHRKILTKQKFKRIKDNKQLAEKIDITGNPAKLWEYIDETRKVEDVIIDKAK
ncbi:MAG: hypothetical protein ACRDD8_05220 [Bacteroidales bacterium]